MEAAASPRRPGGVTTIGVVLYIVAFLNLMAGVVLLVVDAVSDVGEPLHSYEAAVAVLLIVWGVLLLMLARGITQGSNVARVLWLVLMGIEVLAGISALVQDHIGVGLVGLIVPLFLMYLVLSPSADEFFRES